MNETGLRVQEKILTFFIRRYAMLVIAIGFSLTALSLDAIHAHGGNGLYDDFSSGELDRTLWDMSQAGDNAKLTEIDGNNALHITGEQNDYVSIGFKDTEVNNATVFEAKIRIADFGTGDGVINFNLMSENPGHASGYSALMSSNGGFLADRNGSFEGLPSSQSTPFSLKKDQWHTVRFELENQELTLTVDGTVVHVAEVESEQSGKPVFIIDRGMEVFIDDVHVGDSADLATVLETSIATAQPTSTSIPSPTLEQTPTPTPTATPTPEQTATPDATPELLVLGVVEITTGPANIRSGASRSERVVGSAQVGEKYQVVSVIEDSVTKKPMWFEVIVPEEEEAGESSRQPLRGFISATLVKYTRDEKVAESLLPQNVLVSQEDLANFPTRITGERVLMNAGESFAVNVDLRQVEQLRTLDGSPLQLGVYYRFPNLEPRLNIFPPDRRVYIAGVVTDIAENGGNYVVTISFPNERTGQWSTTHLFLMGAVERISVVSKDGLLVPAPTENIFRAITVSEHPGSEQIGYHDRTLIVPTTVDNVTLAVGQPAVASVYLDSPSSDARLDWNEGRTYEEVVRELLDDDHGNNGQVILDASDLLIPQS